MYNRKSQSLPGRATRSHRATMLTRESNKVK